EAFRTFQAFLETTFPSVHATLKHELVREYRLPYTWPGTDVSLKPILLMAHQDVVPADAGTLNQWVHPPFDGVVADGYVWGRGTLDDKGSLMAIREAAESLIRDGFKPARTVYFSFGHDEELGGSNGAPKVAELLKSRGVALESALDEGGMILDGIVPGVPCPVAAIGIAEKGYVSLELKVNGNGGHSSTPPKHTTLGILAKAITRIENNPFPANMTFAEPFFANVGPRMPLTRRALFANMWAFAPLIKYILGNVPEMNACIRTTAAATMASAGVKENVLPSRATAVVNFRILTGDTVETVKTFARALINDDNVVLTPIGHPREPSPVSDTHSAAYARIERTLREVQGGKDIIFTPYLTLGATDGRNFCGIAENVYRFLALSADEQSIKSMHGVNERVAVSSYAGLIRFYVQYLRNCGKELEVASSQ
ncbi:MAG: M20/M25/M40 family metallo-hydrolase, partial [Candidatus Hydrogenedentes bacterium]|nr:M20/M25/M40 family metallo-hydrolase [Candidatus Hydrogenedentota bacterium]